jgi:hypothetical protein
MRWHDDLSPGLYWFREKPTTERVSRETTGLAPCDESVESCDAGWQIGQELLTLEQLGLPRLLSAI